MIDRYSSPSMSDTWSDESMYLRWIQIEAAVLKAQRDKGIVPSDVSPDLWVAYGALFHEWVAEEEKRTKHDFTAFLNVLRDRLPEKTRNYVHLGLTSSDVKDTALMMAIMSASNLICAEAGALRRSLYELSNKYSKTPILGRTHGKTATLMPLGLKFAVWAEEIARGISRLHSAQIQCRVGKLSGPVGSYSQYVTRALEHEILNVLKLSLTVASSQIIQRDRIAQMVAALAILASSMAHVAENVRLHCIEEVGEFEEGFSSGQTGSSAMPHKKNPIGFEQISGLARMVRALVVPAMENMELWHERDMSHSSVERMILPDAFGITYYMLVSMKSLMCNLVINEKKISDNINKAMGKWATARLLSSAIDAGADREVIYRRLQEIATVPSEELKTFCNNDAVLSKYLTPAQIADCFDVDSYMKYCNIRQDCLYSGCPPEDIPEGD